MNKSVDNYFIEGCGRCPLAATPQCKVHSWIPELELLRTIVLECGLTEESKWGVPCYTYQNKNVLIISAFKKYCSINFFKGALFSAHQGILEAPGENSQAARMIKFTKKAQIEAIINEIRSCVYEAIEVEKAGLKVPFKKSPEPLPEELLTKFDEDPILKSAFDALTPGRQRGYILHFSQPKQSKTRTSRILKCTSMILAGIGLNDKYKAMKK